MMKSGSVVAFWAEVEVEFGVNDEATGISAFFESKIDYMIRYTVLENIRSWENIQSWRKIYQFGPKIYDLQMLNINGPFAENIRSLRIITEPSMSEKYTVHSLKVVSAERTVYF